MAETLPRVSRPHSLDDMVALNDEIAALVQAGVPLELGLAHLGRDLPGQLGQLTTRLATRLQQGQSLTEALAAEEKPVPEIYRAVVEAGLRSGQLGLALAALSTSARRTLELRRTTGLALLYPLMVVLVAWGLVCLFATVMGPNYWTLPEARGVLLEQALALRPRLWILGPLVPLGILSAALLWWIFSSQARNAGKVGWIPGWRRLQTTGSAAILAENLALLVEHGVPLSEALRLSSQASGNLRFVLAGQELAASLQTGVSVRECGSSLNQLPALVRWLLLVGSSPQKLSAGLRRVAESYQQQARHLAERAQIVLPLILTLGIGGGVTLGYTLLVYLPYLQTLRSFVSQE